MCKLDTNMCAYMTEDDENADIHPVLMCSSEHVRVCVYLSSVNIHLHLYPPFACACVCSSPFSMTTMGSCGPPAPFNQSSTMARLNPPYLYTIRLERIAALLSTTK